MSAPQQQWLLKVIVGPHQGAEMGLYAGKTLIGSDDECDVVLHDVLVAPQHVELELSASGIMAAPMGGRVFINGKRIREARQPLPSFAFLSIGGSHLVLGPADGTWPLLSAADLPDLEKETEPPAASPDATPNAQAATAEEASKSSLQPITSEGKVTPAAQPAPSSTSKTGPILGILAGIILLIGWAVVYKDFFSGGGQKNPGQTASAPEDDVANLPLTRVKAVIKELGLSDSIAVSETAGRLTVSGYVDSESKQRELQAALRATVPGLRTKIYSLEKIASTARSLIESQRLPLTASSLSEGNLRISGKLTSADPWIRMKETLLNEVPGLSDIQDDVEIEAPRPMLSSKPSMVSGPVIATTQAAPMITAAPAPAPSARSIVTVETVAPPAPTVEPSTDHLITQDTIDTPEATISTIRANTNGLGYIRLNTGGVYFVGARLPYGGTVDKIEPDSVTIIEKGQTRTLRPGDPATKEKTPATP